MKVERCTMSSFAVIGKEGSTDEGEGFIARLWAEANAHFGEVAHLAAKNDQGEPLGIWGAMSDRSRSFRPWAEGFSKGLYLAGVQCELDKEAPAGWVKWVIPACEYLYAECDTPDLFPQMIQYMKEQGLELAGAAHDFTCPQTGKQFMFFPIRRL